MPNFNVRVERISKETSIIRVNDVLDERVAALFAEQGKGEPAKLQWVEVSVEYSPGKVTDES